MAISSSDPLFDNIPIGLFRTLVDGTMALANAALADILGFPRSRDLVGTNVVDLYPDPAERERIRALIAAQGGVGSFEVELRRRDGSLCWVRMSARETRDAHGKVSFYEGAVQDIGDRHRLEVALRASEAQHRMLFENSPQPMAVYDARTLEILAVNEAAERAYGYTREELLRMSFGDIPPRDDQARLIEAIERTTRGLPRGQACRQGVWCHLRKDGGEVFAEMVAARILLGGRDAVLVTGIDATERVRAERQLERRARQFEKLADATIAMDTHTDVVGVVRAIQERGRDLLGVERVDVVIDGPDAACGDRADGEEEAIAAPLRDGEGRRLGIIRVGA
jgi:PAS domain S-box-containing protein